MSGKYGRAILLFGFAMNAGLSYVQLSVRDLFAREKVVALDAYHGHDELNNGQCSMIPRFDSACSDIAFSGNEAFMACSSYDDRLAFYPPGGRNNESARMQWQDPLWRYNIDTKKLDKIELEGVDELVHHGLAIYESSDDPNEIRLFIGSHGRNQSSVNIFKHTRGTMRATLVRSVYNYFVVTPNSIQPTGPDSYYVTNDHKFRSGPLREIEDRLGHWRWGSVVHCDITQNFTCRPCATSLARAHGIVQSGDKTYVADFVSGKIRVYKEGPEHRLDLVDTVLVGSVVEHLTPLSNGNFLIAAMPEHEYAKQWVKDHVTKAPSMVLVFDVSSNTIRPVFHDSTFGSATVAAMDPKQKVMLLGGSYSSGVLRCEANSRWQL